MEDFWRVISEVDLYGSPEAGRKALNLYFAVNTWVYESSKAKDPRGMRWSATTSSWTPPGRTWA
jgi:hypothetical protein